MEQTHCYSYFSICSNGVIEAGSGFIANENSGFDPDEMTKRLGLQPFQTHRMGTLRRPGRPECGVYPFSDWAACRQEEPALDAQEQCRSIVRALNSKIPILNEIRRELDVGFSLLIVPHICHEEGPVLCFDREIIEFCYLTGTEIGIDQYIYGEERGNILETEDAI